MVFLNMATFVGWAMKKKSYNISIYSICSICFSFIVYNLMNRARKSTSLTGK
jgi:hypothetical protein